MSERRHLLQWNAPGPVAQAFYNDRSPMAFLNGPIGSGKTRTSLTKLFRLAREQRRSPIDGMRYSKWLVVRDTYRRMAVTVLETWFKIVSKDMGKLRDGGNNGPSFHHLRWEGGDGSKVDMQVLFAAIGDQDIEDFCRGFEVTGAFVNEADLMAPELWVWLPTRTGRYPDIAHGGPSWHGVIGDMNAPIIGTWGYEQFYDREPAYPFFRQPGGREPGAENLQNLPPDYYERMIEQLLKEPDGEMNVRRLVDNLPGYSREGRPVYQEFNDALHVAGAVLEPDSGLPLTLGLDAGLHPAATLGQRRPNGQRRTLDELYCPGMGPVRFGETINQLLAEPRYRGLRVAETVADPSAEYGADKEGGELNWIEIVEATTGLKVKAAPTNELNPRIEALREPLRRMIDGREPGYLLSPRCRDLRAALNSEYRFRKLAGTAGRQYTPTPEKNEASHLVEAEQYRLLSDGEYQTLRGRKQARSAGRGGSVQAKTRLSNYGRRR